MVVVVNPSMRLLPLRRGGAIHDTARQKASSSATEAYQLDALTGLAAVPTYGTISTFLSIRFVQAAYWYCFISMSIQHLLNKGVYIILTHNNKTKIAYSKHSILQTIIGRRVYLPSYRSILRIEQIHCTETVQAYLKTCFCLEELHEWFLFRGLLEWFLRFFGRLDGVLDRGNLHNPHSFMKRTPNDLEISTDRVGVSFKFSLVNHDWRHFLPRPLVLHTKQISHKSQIIIDNIIAKVDHPTPDFGSLEEVILDSDSKIFDLLLRCCHLESDCDLDYCFSASSTIDNARHRKGRIVDGRNFVCCCKSKYGC